MALYFFHLREGLDTLLDLDGREIADPASIPALALRDARGLISQEALDGAIGLRSSIQVRNNEDVLVHELHFRDAVRIS
jgi:hypothetical protein